MAPPFSQLVRKLPLELFDNYLGLFDNFSVQHACVIARALALGAIVIGIRAVIGAVIAGSVVGYEVGLHCDFSCELFLYNRSRL